MMTARPGRAGLRPRNASAPALRAEHRGFELTLRPLWQPGPTPRARRLALGLDASVLAVRLHLGREDCPDPRAIRAALSRAIAAGPIEVDLDGTLTFLGYVDRAVWNETHDDQGAFAAADLDLTLIGKEV